MAAQGRDTGLEALEWLIRQDLVKPALSAIAVLYMLYARACDPVLEFLKQAGLYSEDDIIALVVSTCFEGLRTR